VRLLYEEGSYRLFVAALNREGVLRAGVENLGIKEIAEFPLTSFYDSNMVRQVTNFARFVRSNKISIVQTHDFYTNVFGTVAAALAGVPLRIAAKRETGMRTRGQLHVERRAFGLAHHIVANANGVKDYLVNSGVPAKKIRVINNGVDLARWGTHSITRNSVIEEFNLPKEYGARFVTIVANLRSEVKNHKMFLRAAQIVRERITDVFFLIVGEGELVPEVRDFARQLGLDDRTVFAGRCTNVAALLSISEIGVLTSDSEGMPNSVLEYMAASLPVVATSVGGVNEVVIHGETGYLVGRGEHGAMAEFIIRLLNDKELSNEFGRRGRERIEKEFSLENQLRKTLELYGAKS